MRVAQRIRVEVESLRIVRVGPETRPMNVRFSIVMTVFDTFDFFPRALACVAWQEHTDWELLVMVDGDVPPGCPDPESIVREFRRRHPLAQRIEVHRLPRAEGCFGNVARNAALNHASGDYVCWINHDNLVTPGYLTAHMANIRRRPGCVSVVDIWLWAKGRFHGRYPRALRRSGIDLLCFAVPLETARAVDAFGGASAKEYAADWTVFAACRDRLPVEHNRGAVVGVHF